MQRRLLWIKMPTMRGCQLAYVCLTLEREIGRRQHTHSLWRGLQGWNSPVTLYERIFNQISFFKPAQEYCAHYLLLEQCLKGTDLKWNSPSCHFKSVSCHFSCLFHIITVLSDLLKYKIDTHTHTKKKSSTHFLSLHDMDNTILYNNILSPIVMSK